MYRFEHKEYLILLVVTVIPLLLGLLYFFKIRKWKKALADAHLVPEIMPYFSVVKLTVKWLFRLGAFVLLVLALANLQTGSRLKEEKRSGADLMLCLDVSNSMLAQDLLPNRLTFAKYSIERLLQQLKGDRVGLVIFAGDAYLQLPITNDYGASRMFLRSVETGIVPVQGTNLSAALQKAYESFGQDIGKNKAIILISDGEDHEQGAIEKAKEIAEKGIMINTIGIGSEQGVPIPVFENGKAVGYKKDAYGQTVVTKLNPRILKEIAAAGNGVYVQATQQSMGLELVLRKIDELEKKNLGTQAYYDFESQYHWFLGGALALMLLDMFLTDRKFMWLKKWYEKTLF
ncbi:MAG: VWA domain-containing protein [Bacteroidia bacterium]|nr:VWA domain-containing protein [Bacteroidia bacterium]